RWPGNVRELQNAVERGVLLCESAVLEPADLGLEVPEEEPLEFDEPSEAITMAEAEKRCILHALEACDWNQVHAARLLAIHRNTLHKKIVDLGLKPPARA
ncbi:sigma-54-dependent Fis family transcriptional regulator, partial [bacterium]|nr:sigma-54-dependent Fis family transcriptional regulator [bacterium]